MYKGKCQTQAQKIWELEVQRNHLQKQLDLRTQQLAETETKLKDTEMWLRTYKARYLALLTENADLTAINTALKRKNASLESTAKAFRAIIINFKRKEI